MSESSMVERVAIALAGGGDVWRALDERDRHGHRQAARCAIEAMREPTNAMASAAYLHADHTIENVHRALPGQVQCAAIWKAMVDRALK